MSDRSLPDEARSLFREAPETFIPARNALERRLRDEGRAEEAATVKALRKPTVVAWALNQLSERDPNGIRALLEAGAEVRAAQQAALSSKRGATARLREATSARRAAVATLATAAAAELADAGRGADAHAEAITQALDAASVDSAAGETLVAGTFERPPTEPAGFGSVFGLSSIDGGGAEAPAPAGRNPRRGARSAGLTELRADVARLRRDRDAAARRAGKSRAAADGFARELDGMRRRLEVVERKHADAAAAAGEAELEAARAERALQEATERLAGAEREG
jgi:hypothetical protein